MVKRGASATIVAVVAILAIVILELYAMHEGVNGTTFSLAIGGITFVFGGFVGIKIRDMWRG
jgi:hypothetical protein